jgi:hypothetical protein
LPRLTAAQFGVAPSYLFYAAWDWRFCLLMSFVTVNAFTAGHLVSSFERSERQLSWRGASELISQSSPYVTTPSLRFRPSLSRHPTYFACAALSMEHYMLKQRQ